MTSSIAKPRIVAFTGSTRRPSKSRTLAETIGRAVANHIDARIDCFDVADARPGLGAAFNRHQLSAEASVIVEAVERADALIAITPVYKGSYTGLFKHLFDFVDQEALANLPVLIGATGGGHRHALIVEHQLRPLFGFFSSQVVSTAIYASDHEFLDGRLVDPGVIERVETAALQLAALLEARRPSELLAGRQDRLDRLHAVHAVS
ncbi:NAD(P)H-dependent oxidoreductase (plasmid) [Microvirga sp. RSM25]|uniref:NAD(P)H-dependent oxidoreductase n=1 Tax=Microvirga sp. RSM25 TaxID=3273802 RepID=UPI00384B45C6